MSSKIHLKKNEDRRIKSGHQWVFSNEINKIEGEPENGEIVELLDSKGNFLGKGFYNKNSLIAVRILQINNDEDFQTFIKKELLAASCLREKVYPSRSSFRLVFSESDFLPGLIVDKYNNTFVLQIYSAGMEKNIQSIVDVLKQDFKANNIFTKNESYFRVLEGLSEENKVYMGEMKDEIINDGAINYKINFQTGHKTGFYFDQSDNRFFIEKLSQGMNVLDAFCNSGGFGLHASYAGASSVTLVDSSHDAIKTAEENYNLKKCNEENRYFDLVNLDPPAFAKNKKSLSAAIKGYEKLNKMALSIIKDGGYLSTSSCSYHLNESEFLKAINTAAIKSNKTIQLIYQNGASMDHPSLPAMPETSYLKYAVFKVQNS